MAGVRNARLRIEGTTEPFDVVALSAREAVGELFVVELSVGLADPESTDTPLDELLGRGAEVSLGGADERVLHGVVRRVEDDARGGAAGSLRVTVAPRAIALALREDCRVFENRTVPEVLAAVCDDAGLGSRDVRFALRAPYRASELTVQYRESDWAFVSRLMEEAGIFCFFEHDAGHDVLVFADTSDALERIPEPSRLALRGDMGALQDDEHVARFVHVEELRPGRVSLRGHSVMQPRMLLESDARAGRDEVLVIHDGPVTYDSPDVGPDLARLRLEREQAARRTVEGVGLCTRLSPGFKFELEGHPRVNLNREYFVTAVEHRMGALDRAPESAPEGAASRVETRFSCIPARVPYRPPLRTPKPSVRGVLTGVVVGPPGEEVHCDAMGRVKIRFHFDRRPAAEPPTAWVRVSLPWAGPGYGALFVPRVGHEVLLTFVGGDPDRPLVAGSVHDAVNVPTGMLPADRAVVALRTSSSPGGEGYSELRFDDRRGAEVVGLHSHRDLAISVGQDKNETVAADETVEIGADRVASVGGAETIRVSGDRSLHVGQNHHVAVALDATTSIVGQSQRTVGADDTATIEGAATREVGGTITEIAGHDLRIEVGASTSITTVGSHVERVGGAREVDVDGRLALRVGGDATSVVEGSSTESVARTRRIDVGETLEIGCGDTTIVVSADGQVTIRGTDVRVTSEGPVSVAGHKLLVHSTGAVSVRAEGPVKIRGGNVDLN